MNKQEIGEMIRTRRLARGMTQEQLAEKVGLTPSGVGMIERGVRLPSKKYAEAFAKAFNIPVWAIMYKEEEMQPVARNIIPLDKLQRHRIPLIGSVAGGEPIYDEEVDLYIDGPIKASCAVRLKGDSMAPTYLDGDIIYVREQPDVNDGQIAVVFVDDEAVLKRVYHEKDGLSLLSINPMYKPMIATFEEYNNIRILGVPCGFTRMYDNNTTIDIG